MIDLLPSPCSLLSIDMVFFAYFSFQCLASVGTGKAKCRMMPVSSARCAVHHSLAAALSSPEYTQKVIRNLKPFVQSWNYRHLDFQGTAQGVLYKT